MSPHAIIWWTFATAVAVTIVLAAVQVVRALGELKRLGARVEEFAELPVVGALARAEQDARRLEAASTQIAPLIARAQLAVATIKRGPLPPELVSAVRRLRAETATFRAFARR
jgi:hypothetical protein